MSQPAERAQPAADSRVHALLRRTPLRVRRPPHALVAWPTALAPVLSSQLVALAAHVAAAPASADAAADATHAAHAALRGALVCWCVDDLELSAVIPQSALASLPAPTSCERDWAVITLDTVMTWNVTGVLAAVSGALAAAGIPIGAITAFSRDHVLVPQARLPDALAALAGLCGEVRADG